MVIECKHAPPALIDEEFPVEILLTNLEEFAVEGTVRVWITDVDNQLGFLYNKCICFVHLLITHFLKLGRVPVSGLSEQRNTVTHQSKKWFRTVCSRNNPSLLQSWYLQVWQMLSIICTSRLCWFFPTCVLSLTHNYFIGLILHDTARSHIERAWPSP
jgi:hypothetical protein